MIHIALAAALLAQAAPAPVDCTDADHGAFNFWIGDWSVSPTGSDSVIAESTISPAAGGCAIREDFRQTVGPAGTAIDYHGASFSSFDARNGGKWRQFYVDSSGAVAAMEGGVRDGAMVLEVEGPNGVRRRMTVAPQPDGSVRQSGDVTTDGGVTWTAGYDFTYRRRGGA
jgi:hypothetical protein